MMIKSLNYDNLYIDEDFDTIHDLKIKIYEKYKIQIETQHIIFNGKFYVLGLFEHPLTGNENIHNNLFGELGCPDDLFNSLISKGMEIDEIKKYLFPHEEDSDEKNIELNISEIINIQDIINKMNKRRNIDEIHRDFTNEQKLFIIKNSKNYINSILKDFIEK